MTPGYKTTEFWKAIVTQVITMLVITGVIAHDDGDTLAAALGNAITAATALVANALVVYTYIRSRTTLKATQPPLAG